MEIHLPIPHTNGPRTHFQLSLEMQQITVLYHLKLRNALAQYRSSLLNSIAFTIT